MLSRLFTAGVALSRKFRSHVEREWRVSKHKKGAALWVTSRPEK